MTIEEREKYLSPVEECKKVYYPAGEDFTKNLLEQGVLVHKNDEGFAKTLSNYGSLLFQLALIVVMLKMVSNMSPMNGNATVEADADDIAIGFDDVIGHDEVKADLLKGGVPTGVCGPRVRTVTACQGKEICPNGLINTYEIAEEFHKRYFGRELPHKFKFGVTGCRANCLKTEENDFGVKGGMEVKIDNEKCKKCGVCVKACRWNAIQLDKATGITFDESKCVKCGRCVKACPFDAWSGEAGYVVSLGGLFGNEIYKGESFLPLIKDKETLFRVADAAITYFAENAKPSERFRFMIQRTGEEQFKKVILDAYNGEKK